MTSRYHLREEADEGRWITRKINVGKAERTDKQMGEEIRAKVRY